MVNQMLNLLKTRNLKAANGQPINITWETTVVGAAMLTLAINLMNIRADRVLTINRAYLPSVLHSNSKQLQIWSIKSKVYKLLQYKIKANSSSSNNQGTSSRGALNSLKPTANHSLSNSIILLKTNQSISIKARLIRPVVSSVLMQSHIHNINIKHLFSNLIRNKPNQFSRGNSATATISSSRPPQVRLSKHLKDITLTGVALTLVRSTWVSHACSWIFSHSKWSRAS